mgnify:CR=1 FL=1
MCLDDFKVEFEKLKDKKAYKDLESDLIDYFFDKPINSLMSGTRLNNSELVPYIKKRLGGRGGYRVYFLLLIKDEQLILMYIHPKTGAVGSPNITDASKAYLYKKVLVDIQSNGLFELKLDENKRHIIFEK